MFGSIPRFDARGIYWNIYIRHRWVRRDGLISAQVTTTSSLVRISIWNGKIKLCSKAYRGKKWNESGFSPPLCTYRLNWARRTSWGWWDDWDDTVLQTQDSKFEPWRSEAEHATSRSRRLPAILIFTRGWGRNIFVSFKPPSAYRGECEMGWSHHTSRSESQQHECEKLTSRYLRHILLHFRKFM